MKIFLEEKIPRIAAWLLPLLVIGSIVYMRPHWGLMDDVTNIFTLVPRMRANGIFRTGWEYGIGDIGWGMFRPTYPPMVYFVYVPGMATAPWVTFAWNAILVFGVTAFYASVLARILRLPLHLVALAMGAFFYGHDLFQHPSLQEKMILLAGAGLTWHLWNRDRWGVVGFWVIALVWVVFGACVKASFVIHYSVAFMAFAASQWSRLRGRDARAISETIIFALIGLAMVLAFAFISRHGSYTANFTSHKILPNLTSVHGPLFLVPIFAALFWRAKRWRETWANPELLLPVTGVAAYLTIFASWGIGGYVQSVIAPLFAALLVQLCVWYLRALPRWSWILPLTILSIGITTYRSLVNFGRLHDIGAIVDDSASIQVAGVSELWMPCNEGSLSMDRFFREANSSIRVKELAPEGPTAGRSLLYDQAMCPLAGRVAVAADCLNPELIRAGMFPKSYRVMKCN